MALPIIDRVVLDIEPMFSQNPYLNSDETSIVVALMRSVGPRVVVEIGCSIGLTARCILDYVSTVQKYIAVDVPPDHEPTLPGQRGEIPAEAGVCAASDSRFSVLIRDRGSLDLLPDDLEPCDAVFIDGDHSERAVMNDSGLALSLLRPGGVIIFHDYGNPTVEVTPILDFLYRERNWPLQHVERSWIAFAYL
jgi:predicted O-methyltransferase YrrM